jgi:hypothetical protein
MTASSPTLYSNIKIFRILFPYVCWAHLVTGLFITAVFLIYFIHMLFLLHLCCYKGGCNNSPYSLILWQ